MSSFLDFVKENIVPLEGTFYSVAESDGEKTDVLHLTDANACQNSYSVAKAFAVTAIGFLYDEGKINTDEKITDIFSEELPARIDEKWHRMTLHHVLTHSCGFPVGYLDIDAVDSNSFGSDDYLGYLFNTELMYEPGEKRTYSDAAYYLISRVVSKKSGEPLDNFLWKRLFYPMGFKEMAWSRCPMGYPMGATGLYIYTDDMVKLGELYMCDGVYRGKRLISSEWVETVKDRRYEFHPICGGIGYGKGGANGQMLAFFPSVRKAVAWHSYGGEGLLDIVGKAIGNIDIEKR